MYLRNVDSERIKTIISSHTLWCKTQNISVYYKVSKKEVVHCTMHILYNVHGSFVSGCAFHEVCNGFCNRIRNSRPKLLQLKCMQQNCSLWSPAILQWPVTRFIARRRTDQAQDSTRAGALIHSLNFILKCDILVDAFGFHSAETKSSE
jgi:hypothetical protein